MATYTAFFDIANATVGPVIGIAKSFVETDQQGLGLSCVGCHMPAVRRPWANADPASPDESGEFPVRSGKSHRLATPRDPEFLRRAFRRPPTAIEVRTRKLDGLLPGLIEHLRIKDLLQLALDLWIIGISCGLVYTSTLIVSGAGGWPMKTLTRLLQGLNPAHRMRVRRRISDPLQEPQLQGPVGSLKF